MVLPTTQLHLHSALSDCSGVVAGRLQSEEDCAPCGVFLRHGITASALLSSIILTSFVTGPNPAAAGTEMQLFYIPHAIYA